MIFQPLLEFRLHLVALAHLVQLAKSGRSFLRVTPLNGVEEPVVLSGRAGRGPVQAEPFAVCKALHIVRVSREGFYHLPPVCRRDARDVQPIFHHIDPGLPELPVVGFQFLFVHAGGVLPDQGVQLRGSGKQVVDGADVGRAHHIVVRAVHCVAHHAVDFRTKQEVARRALGEQPRKPVPQAFGGHVSVLVLLAIPPMQQEVRTNFHQGKHRRLHHLACRRPAQALPGPLHFGLVLGALLCIVPGSLGVVVHHRIGEDTVVLEPLGREHGQRLGDLVVAALDARPLHHGVVGLGLLNDLLVHLVHGFPVGVTALGGRAVCKLFRVVFHIMFRTLPQCHHRDLVHLVDPAGHALGQFVHGLFGKAPRNADGCQLSALAAPQSVL